MHISLESLKKTHGDNALAVYKQIARLVGGDDSGQSEGGMDLSDLEKSKMKEVEKLLKVDKKEGE